ncbi:spermidine synthase [Novosphingobium sp. B 225]|uniref:spermidine synthase n=1 Tax=Novosphingobium sp. B 225 TaxID=1961849 RepID=UPI000B4AACDD|nr:fused MFS/spermidine synthase [Novosphingobium sp. B 225]
MSSAPNQRATRPLYVLTILTGSFLLFLIQPMVARMALPRLGGAPNVWNSAMLVYQALLLGGYYYAHRLSQLPLKRQAQIHLALFALAALTLPVGLVNLSPARAGTEVLWVPALLALSIGPVFFVVSAQAPLMQRWFAADPQAGAPWALYAASNLGSFGGLIAYPLLAEPLLPLRYQSWAWTAGYGLLFVLIALTARTRWHMAEAPRAEQVTSAPVPRRRIALWLVLAAVPSGLMLSTTTHLTTDLFAMPLLWVIPLGIYLLSFSVAFADNRTPARIVSALAWVMILTAGTLAMIARGSQGLLPVIASVALLFFVCTALHARMYDLRPGPDRLTLFYLTMSAGGALGGVFTALLAPVLFDWVWEHPMLVLAAAALLPREALPDWRRLPGLEPEMVRLGIAMLLGIAGLCLWQIHDVTIWQESEHLRLPWGAALALIGLALVPWRALVLPLLLGAMLVQGGLETVQNSRDHIRTRSYFGINTVRDYPEQRLRTLAHGTTLHGEQSTDPKRAREPLTYYGPGSGVAIAYASAPILFGPNARMAVLGLGTGTLACFAKPGQDWTIFEIDPAVLAYSQNGTFTFLRNCTPAARIELGDARLALAKAAPGSFDMLAMDAFSSDSVPMHLFTHEAFGVYLRALSPKGVILVHISNRFIDLEPPLAAALQARGLHAMVRDDYPDPESELTPSSFVAVSRDPQQLNLIAQSAPDKEWRPLVKPAARIWTDDHASILSYVQWRNFLGAPQ